MHPSHHRRLQSDSSSPLQRCSPVGTTQFIAHRFNGGKAITKKPNSPVGTADHAKRFNGWHFNPILTCFHILFPPLKRWDLSVVPTGLDSLFAVSTPTVETVGYNWVVLSGRAAKAADDLLNS